MGYKPVEPAGDVRHCPTDGGVGCRTSAPCPTVKKSFRLPAEWDDALTARNINFSELVRKLICAFLEGKIGLDERGEVVCVGQNVGQVHHVRQSVGQNEGSVGQLKPIQEDIEVLQENIEILFSLNKRREEEIEELKKSIYELEAELRAYLLDRAEKGDISREQKMEVEAE